MKKILGYVFIFLSAVAFIALLYALADSLATGLWPGFNRVMVYGFAEFFPRSLCIYFIFLLPISLLGLPFYYISKRLPVLRRRDAKAAYNVIGAAVSLIIPIILFEIPVRLEMSFFEPVLLIADVAGLLLAGFVAVYLAPLLLSVAVARVPAFLSKSVIFASYLSLGLTAVTLFALTILPEITRPPYNPDAPNILIISIDTLRKDHLSFYGYDNIETPNIDAFLGSATRFDNAYCSSPWTLPSLSAFLTGYQPSVCEVDLSNSIDDEMIILPEVFRENGYYTGCVITNTLLFPEYGFSRGFDSYAQRRTVHILFPFYGTRMYRYSRITRRVLSNEFGRFPSETEFNTINTVEALNKERKRPFFLWCHYMDPHAPYAPPDKYVPDYPETTAELAIKNKYSLRSECIPRNFHDEDYLYLAMFYDGEVTYVDESVGKILGALEKSGKSDNTIVILFNDHGEEFLDHGKFGHGHSIYPEQVDMVLAIRVPGGVDHRPVSDKYVSHLGLMPTILDAAGIESPAGIQGKSFYEEIYADSGIDSPVLSEYMLYGDGETKAIRYKGYCLATDVVSGEQKLFDVETDPTFTRDIYGTLPEIEYELDAELNRMVQENESKARSFDDTRNVMLSEYDLEKLRDMGYMGR